MDPPATPGRGFFFEDAEISHRAVTSPGPCQKIKDLKYTPPHHHTITLDGNQKIAAGQKNIPARDPKQCGAGLHYNMDDDRHDGHDDDDDDDDDDDEDEEEEENDDNE